MLNRIPLLSLPLLVVTACAVDFHGEQLSRADYPDGSRRAVRQCARHGLQRYDACDEIPLHDLGHYPALERGLSRVVERAENLPAFAFDDAFLDLPSTWTLCPAPIGHDGLCERVLQRHAETGRQAEHVAMLDAPAAWSVCPSRLAGPTFCAAVYQRHRATGRVAEASAMIDDECIADMSYAACEEWDALLPASAPHRTWTESDRQARIEADRRWVEAARIAEQERNARLAEEQRIEREIEREEAAERAEERRVRQEMIMDAVQDGIETIGGAVEEGRRQRAELERLRRQVGGY